MADLSPSLPDADSLRQILRQVVDPELGVNIVDLGLIYGIEVTPLSVRVDMTMTSPACPMGEMLVDDVKEALARALPADCGIDVNLVWEPPWEPAMMNERTRAHFGW